MAIECHSCFQWLMPTLERYRREWPQVELDFSLGFSFHPLPALYRGDIDLVVTADPEKERPPGGGLSVACPEADQPRRALIAAPRSPGERTVVMPAASIAANLPAAVPWPPEAMAPAWPMRLPGGAEAPAMKPTTGFF